VGVGTVGVVEDMNVGMGGYMRLDRVGRPSDHGSKQHFRCKFLMVEFHAGSSQSVCSDAAMSPEELKPRACDLARNLRQLQYDLMRCMQELLTSGFPLIRVLIRAHAPSGKSLANALSSAP
jgi:hypothetical protein